MKRLALTLILALAALAATAQEHPAAVADSTAAPAPAQSLRQMPPGGVAREQQYEPFEYRRPRRNPMRYFGHDFYTYFLEAEGALGHNAAIGLNLAYVPDEWGIYGSYKLGYYADWVSLGAVRRLSGAWQNTDWQLYFGLNLSQWLGYEAGVRWASARHSRSGSLCWDSASLGLARNAGHTYLMLGCSFDLTALLFVPILLW